MVTRNYQAPEFGLRDTRQVRGTEISRANTDARPPIQSGDPTWRARMFEQMGSQWGNTLNKMADIEYSNQYLEGAAQAGLIQSEDELQGDPLTRDWKVAGYRDTMGKLALADSEAQFAVDLAELRTQDTEEFQAYLSQRRAKLNPAMASASREARAAMAGQMLLQDRAATKQWTTERKKYIVEQRTQATHTLANTHFKAVQNLQMKVATNQADPADLKTSLQNLGGAVFAGVWEDPAYTEEHKQELTYNLINQALAQEIVPLYDYLNSTVMPDGKGGESTMLARLTGEQQTKLSSAYVSAMRATADKRNLARRAELARDRALIDAGRYQGTFDEYDTKLQEMVLNGIITGDQRQAELNNFLDRKFKLGTQQDAAQALQRGDLNGVYNLGKTVAQAADDADAMLTSLQATPEMRLNYWLDVGLNSHDIGFDRAGQALSGSLRNIRQPDGTILPQHREVFVTINSKLRQAEGNGYEVKRSRLLSGLGEEDRMFAERIFRAVDDGATYEEAVARATRSEESEKALSPSQRASMGQKAFTDASDKVKLEASQGLLQQWWSSARALFPGKGGAEASADVKIRPENRMSFRDGFFSDSAVVKLYEQGMRDALIAELGNVTLMHPTTDADSAVRTAKANLAARTIETTNGPVYLPRNANAAQIFGVGQSNVPALGKAIDGLLPQSKSDTRWHLAFTNGRLLAQEYSGDTRIGNAKFIDPQAVRAKMQEQMKADADKANAIYGSGVEIGVQDGGGTLKFNGANKSGVPEEWMYGFRNNLVKHEGVRTTPYRDLSGNVDKAGNPIMTVGVGVSSHNPHYPKPGADGKIDGAALRNSFLGASNDAAAAGAAAARAVSRWNPAGFQLMSELAYQSGTGFMSVKNGKTGQAYRAFAETLRGSDVAAAQAAFKNTAAWYYSRNPKKPDELTPRQKSYLKLIEQTMKG